MQFAGEPFQRAIQDARRRLAFERRTRRAAEAAAHFATQRARLAVRLELGQP